MSLASALAGPAAGIAFALADGASVTVLGIRPGGTACVLATGSALAVVDPAAAPAPGRSV
ncbi:hypothetical protein [Inquilinus sp. Marseille-Q2685]|uniref:hypothetical protein n=1 Tax=Inquilinus sp. Marseille-Q2685 TaxID=2866581 RepID=UPI001CE48CFF|nr:hypothetical protein [Inquilinus sp. Marseille-Q2685]